MTESNVTPSSPVAAPDLSIGPKHPTARPAMFSARAWLILIITIAVGLGFDLGTKVVAFANIADYPVTIDRSEVIHVTQQDPRRLATLLPVHEPVVAIPHLLEFQLVLNTGAVFGAGQGKRWFFIGFTMVALLFALSLFAFATTRTDRMAHVCIGLIIAGGVGNLYDRIRFACVRDFIHPLPHLKLPFGLTWPSGDPHLWPYVSNVADALLLIGIGLLLIKLWRNDSARHPKSPLPAPPAQS